jgi:hypothetical protein
MDNIEKKWAVFGMILILLAVLPATVLATPNGQPFDEIWAEIDDQQLELDAEIAARIAGDLALLDAINAEEAARIAADDALQADLEAETLSRTYADIALHDALSTETAARIASDDALQDAIDLEEAARVAVDNGLQTAISAEQAARIAGDNALQANLDAEETARIAGDSALQTAIDAEKAARIAGDNALQTNINTLASKDALDYDSLADLEDAMRYGVDLAKTSGYVGIGTTTPHEKLHVDGKIKADKLVYTSPRTHYLFLGAEAFQPASDVAYSSNYGIGGAHINSGSGGMVAPVYLPDGAKVTEFRVYFKDNSASNIIVKFERLLPTTGSYNFLATVDSSGISGFGNKATTSIYPSTIYNSNYPYHIWAYSSSWDGDKMEIFGVRFTYTISTAE